MVTMSTGTNAGFAGQPGAPEKAIIRDLTAQPHKDIPCMFIPKQFAFLKTNGWQETTLRGSDTTRVQFNGGQAITFSMELFFDTTETGGDVRDYTNEIWNLMKINEKTRKGKYKGNPPMCQFSWGNMLSFTAVIQKINQTFTLFKNDGTPLRATLNVDFLQAQEIGFPKQNPTSVSVPGYKTRRVRQGETIDSIAHEEYGDPTLWRLLADVNDLEDPMRLPAGQLLAIPPSP